MKQEFNPNTLKKAVTQLPNYEPPSEIWSAIDKELNLQKGIRALPLHQPNDLVWQTIESNLAKSAPFTTTTRTNSGSSKRLFWLKRLSIAASFLLVIGVNWWTVSNNGNPNKFSYTQETINAQLLIADWDEDANALAQIEAICQVKSYSCTAPEFQQLEQELKELNEAKSELKQAIDHFGKDTQLIAQLSEVELERTAILKKMMANLL